MLISSTRQRETFVLCRLPKGVSCRLTGWFNNGWSVPWESLRQSGAGREQHEIVNDIPENSKTNNENFEQSMLHTWGYTAGKQP